MPSQWRHCKGKALRHMWLKSLLRQDAGATAIEYGLIAALLAVGLIASLGRLKTELRRNFDKIAVDIDSAGTS